MLGWMKKIWRTLVLLRTESSHNRSAARRFAMAESSRVVGLVQWEKRFKLLAAADLRKAADMHAKRMRMWCVTDEEEAS